MKLSKIEDYFKVLERTFAEDEIVSVEMNEFVLRVEVTWDIFINYLKTHKDPECYGRLDKQDNRLVLSFRLDDGVVLVAKRPL